MEERVKMLGVSFELWSRENPGARISFTIPLPREE
jgi:signal transduction histidine kinase